VTDGVHILFHFNIIKLVVHLLVIIKKNKNKTHFILDKVQLKCGGTRWRTGGESEGETGEWSG